MPEQPIKDRRAPILDHLTELRCRITWSVLVIVIFSGLAFAFHQQILSLLMEPAQDFTGVPAVVEDLQPYDLYTADEAFFTGTAAEVTPIRELDSRQIGAGRRGPITEKLQKAYFDLVTGQTAEHAEWRTLVG